MSNYLYNGFELLDINTAWTDKETYPYAILYEDSGDFRLTYSNQATVYKNGGPTYVGGTTYVSYIYMTAFPDGMTEEEFEEMVGVDAKLNEWFFFEEKTLSASTSVKLGATAFWSSYDVVDESGVVCLAASKPEFVLPSSRVIYGNVVGGVAPLNTLILQDESGNEVAGVAVANEVVFTATDNDVREGAVYAGDAGVSTGTKVIPSYHTRHGVKAVPAGSAFAIKITSDLNLYDYTVMHAMICAYNTNITNSVAVEKVSILDKVYPVQSTQELATVIKDADTQSIQLGITNDTDNICILRYITYKEIE